MVTVPVCAASVLATARGPGRSLDAGTKAYPPHAINGGLGPGVEGFPVSYRQG